MDSTFDERRDAIKFASQKKIAQAHTADRQARDRARKQAKSKTGFESLSEAEQDQAIEEAEEKVVTQRASKGHDMETKRAAILDEESALISQINEEEKARRLELLGAGVDEGKGKKRAREDDSEEESIKKAFNKRMTPVIEKLERQIITGGAAVVPGVSQKDLEEFTAKASNPEDVAAYLEYWGDDDVDLDEGLDGNGDEDEDDDSDDLVVVVSEDEEEEDSDEEEDLADFINDDEEL